MTSTHNPVHRLWYLLLIIMLWCVYTTLIIKLSPATNTTRHVIHSEKVMNLLSRATGFSKELAKAAAPLPPFVILRRTNHPMNETWIRHEQTHHLQMLESLYLRQLISHGEYRYVRIIMKKDHMSAYLRKATEQEAYLNQTNPTYNQTRPRRATRHYLRNKTPFHFENYQVVIEN